MHWHTAWTKSAWTDVGRFALVDIRLICEALRAFATEGRGEVLRDGPLSGRLAVGPYELDLLFEPNGAYRDEDGEEDLDAPRRNMLHVLSVVRVAA